MLQSHVFPPLLVPPEQGALVGAVDAVEGGHTPVINGGVGSGTASRVEEDGVMAQGQGDVVVPGGAHRADVSHALYRLKHPQHPGDAPLGQSLIDDVRLGHPQLGQSLFQVVEHDGHRPVLADVLGAALPGEGIHIGENGLRVGLHRSQHRRVGGLRGGGGRRLLGTAGGQGEQKRAAYQKGEHSFAAHRTFLLCVHYTLLSFGAQATFFLLSQVLSQNVYHSFRKVSGLWGNMVAIQQQQGGLCFDRSA